MSKHGPGCRLYLITPPVIDAATFTDPLAAALDAGDVAALQVRLKDVDDDTVRRATEALAPICQDRNVPLIMNDRPDLAREMGCDGVHVGQSDASYEAARGAVGQDGIVGVTCHASRHLAMVAGDAGADYVAFGAFFPSTTKQSEHHPEPELLNWWSETTIIQCCAIGGITAENCAPLVAAGADFLAVISAVWDHLEGPAAGVKAFEQAIQAAGRDGVASAGAT